MWPFSKHLKTKFLNYFLRRKFKKGNKVEKDENSTSILGSSTKLENKCLANHALYYTDMGNSHLYDYSFTFLPFLGSVANFVTKFGFS